MKKLPIGIQTFSKIIEGDFVYVDKTNFALKLIKDGGGYYFLSRPRRFGKSLFLDTLYEIFRGRRDLFKGLSIYDNYDFTPYPVIRISFGSGDYCVLDSIDRELRYIFEENMEELGVECRNRDDIKLCFRELIKNVCKKFDKKVVILIDEYDKPILDNIKDKKKARYARDILKNLYSVIKDSDRYVRFVFITGVSKFSKLSLFSGLNNLKDITVSREYAEICGYTQQDLETVFSEHLKGASLQEIKKWYNGYYYLGEKLYNPFDILLFISEGFEFKNYWWSTGNPSFLIDKLREENYYIPALEYSEITEESLDSFDVDYIDVLALFWQTGYLTFKDKKRTRFGRNIYTLAIPNLEIRFSLNELLIDYLTNQRHKKNCFRQNLDNALFNGDFKGFIDTLKSIFSSIPYHNYANNIIASYEGYYASVVYVYLCALGYDVIPEDVTNRGRIDLSVKLPDKIIIIEFKVDSMETPIAQIEERRYFEKYTYLNKPIYSIGINFDSREKNIVAWDIKEHRSS